MLFCARAQIKLYITYYVYTYMYSMFYIIFHSWGYNVETRKRKKSILEYRSNRSHHESLSLFPGKMNND